MSCEGIRNSCEEFLILISMCGRSPIIVKTINAMTKLNGFPSRPFLRNIMPVTLGQFNDTAHLPRDSSGMLIYLFFLSFLKS